MTAATRNRRAAVAAAVALLALTGCTSGRTAAEPEESGRSSSPTADAGPTRGAASRSATGAPTPGSTIVPRTTSGSLSRHDFPRPSELGTGWKYAVDPGDAEEGYAGNGTPTLERSPEEIVQTAVPFGCPRVRAIPTPGHALEVDYTFEGAKVIAVRSEFRDAPTARAFFTGRAANLRHCLGRVASPAIGPLVDSIAGPAANAVVSDRTPRSDPWQEIAVLDGSTVAMVAVQGPGRLTHSETRRLVALLRG